MLIFCKIKYMKNKPENNKNDYLEEISGNWEKYRNKKKSLSKNFKCYFAF